MDSGVRLYIERAENELELANAVFSFSENKELKRELKVNPSYTFYSAVISHCYYAIFYSVKALLLTQNIKTTLPDVHSKTFDEFKKNFVDTGELDVELLKIYKELVIRAEELLGIFAHEKWKRGHFTYRTVAQANVQPAKDSLDNAKKFVAHINMVISRRDKK